MLEWENTMSSLAGKWTDCLLVLDHLHQMFEEYPWLRIRHEPAIGYMIGIRDGIEETMKQAFVFWNGNFMERLQEMGFENPDP